MILLLQPNFTDLVSKLLKTFLGSQRTFLQKCNHLNDTCAAIGQGQNDFAFCLRVLHASRCRLVAKTQEKDNLGFWPHFAEYGQISKDVIALLDSNV